MSTVNSCGRPEVVVAGDLRVPRPDALLIGGEWRPSIGGEVSKIVSPVTESTVAEVAMPSVCLLYTSPSPRDGLLSRMPSSA